MEIDGTQVLRLLMQFLQETGLSSSLSALQEETGVSLNLLPRPDAFQADCLAGRWDAVLSALGPLRLPAGVLQQLYEVIIMELVEARELDAARAVLRGVLPLALLRSEDGDAYASLESLVSHGSSTSAASALLMGDGGGAASSSSVTALLALQQQPRQARRAAVAAAVLAHTSTAPPSRLLTLLSQALKWQVHTGHLPHPALQGSSGPPDLLSGGRAARVVEDSTPCSGAPGGLLLTYGAGPLRPGALLLTPSGACLVVGGGDGLIEVFEAGGGLGRAAEGAAPGPPPLSPLCPYQAADEFMVHAAAITALTASADGEMLASASADGMVKVWRLSTGECLKTFTSASASSSSGSSSATAAASSTLALAFSRDCSLLVGGGLDGVARVWGLRSGSTVCEMRGHGAHITAVVLMLEEGAGGSSSGGSSSSGSGGRLLTASVDGTVRLWDVRSGEALGVLLGGVAGAAQAGAVGGGSHHHHHHSPVHALAALPAASAAFPAHAAAFFVLRSPPPASAPAGAAAGASGSSGATAAGWSGGGEGGGMAAEEGGSAGAGAPGAPAAQPASLLLLSAARGGAVLQSYALPPGAPPSDSHAVFSSLAVSPTGRYVYAGLAEGSRAIYAWDVATGAALTRRFTGAHDKGVAGLAVHPIRPVLVSWGEEGVVKSWV